MEPVQHLVPATGIDDTWRGLGPEAVGSSVSRMELVGSKNMG